MRRQAKVQSTGSTEGRGRSRRLLLLALLTLAVAIAFGASAASAAAPTVTLDTVENPTYTTVDIAGEIDPMGEPIGWFVEKSTDGVSWEGTSLGNFIDGSQVSGPQPVQGTVEELTAGQTYFFRLVGVDYNDGSETRSAEPYPEITTESIPAPTVTIDPVTTFSATTAHFVGHIDPNPPAGTPEASDVRWHFECSPECPGIGDAQTVAAGAGDTEVEVDATELEPNTHYEVRLVGKNAGPPVSAGPVGFTTDASAPEVQTLPAFAIRGGTEALVGGSINPRNSATTYWVEYGPTGAYGQKIPATPAGAGSGGQLEYFTQRLTGLTPSTLYHVRLVAENSAGPSQGVDQNFETAPASEAIEQGCPNATLRVENNSTALPECRAYEQVSPVDKNGFDVAQFPQGGGEESFLAAKDGSKLAFLSGGAFGDSKSSFLSNQYISSRRAGGWTTHALGPPAPPGRVENPRYFWFSPDLRYGMVIPTRGYHLSPGDFPGEMNFYRQDTETDAFSTLNDGPFPPGENPGFLVVGGSDDGRKMYFASNAALVEGAPGNGTPNVYEWTDGRLQLASVLPNGEPAMGSETVSQSGSTWVSRDGSRMMFKGEESLFLRENQHTYEIVGPGPGNLPEPLGATPDLSGIFFRSSLALTADAANDGLSKIYRYNSGPRTITLISPNATDGGLVRTVPGVSPDGSYVYFRSESQYLPGQGIRGHFGSSNLYMWHDGEVTFIGSELNESFGGDEARYTKFRVSPDGKFVSFVSDERLTAYDNTDATPGPGGATRADSEIYVFDAEAKRLTCVSCNPSGEQPAGTAEGNDASSTFPSQPNTVNNPQAGVGDDGHVFFNSRDALVPADVNGVQDVYEWRDGQIHLISTGTGADPAEYADSGANGRDVFFSTRQQLIEADRDDIVDLYDARVDGGFAQPVVGSRCEGLDACHGPESRGPAEPGLGSPSSAPEGPVDTTRLRLKKALKACKHKPKKQRARCRARVKRKLKKAPTGRTH